MVWGQDGNGSACKAEASKEIVFDSQPDLQFFVVLLSSLCDNVFMFERDENFDNRAIDIQYLKLRDQARGIYVVDYDLIKNDVPLRSGTIQRPFDVMDRRNWAFRGMRFYDTIKTAEGRTVWKYKTFTKGPALEVWVRV